MTQDSRNEVGSGQPKDEVPQLKSKLTPRNRSRRKLAVRGLIGSGILAFSALLGTQLGSKLAQNQPSQEMSQPYSLPSLETRDVFDNQLKLSDMQDLSLRETLSGDNWIDDGHIPYFTTPEGTKRYFIVVGNTTVMFETNGKTLKEAAKEKDFKQVKDVLHPSMAGESDGIFDTYSGITSILQLDKNDPMHIIGIGHFERRIQNAPIYAFP